MREITLNHPAQTVSNPARLARLTRHLKARLLDFGPGGPQVLGADETLGRVTVLFPGHGTGDVLGALAQNCAVHAAQEGDQAVFFLAEDTRFEDLDYVWGCLFEILG